MRRILIVDDEPTLLQLLRRFLERQGYAVETCETAEGALAAFESDGGQVDLVVTDLTLPGLDGAQLIAQLRIQRPGLPAIIVSGYPHEPKLERVQFLLKPFLPHMLAEQIEAILSR